MKSWRAIGVLCTLFVFQFLVFGTFTDAVRLGEPVSVLLQKSAQGCGGHNEAPCTADGSIPCDPGHVLDGNKCKVCGSHGEPVCDNGCNPWHTVASKQNGDVYCAKCGTTNAIECSTWPHCIDGTIGLEGVCKACGTHNKVVCANNACHLGHNAVVKENGDMTCVACGASNQQPCSTGNACESVDLDVFNGKCKPCGTKNKPKCSRQVPTCEAQTTADEQGICRQCGTHNQLACSSIECEAGHVAVANEKGTLMCHSCGKKGMPTCEVTATQSACAEDDLGQNNGKCVYCGAVDQVECQGPGETPCEDETVSDSTGVCRACGEHNQLACDGNICSSRHSLMHKEGVTTCVKCGGEKQPVCMSLPVCDANSLTPYNDNCVSCGTSGKPSCSLRAIGCETGTIADHMEICRPCGKHNQLACSGGVCNEGLTTKPGANDSTMCELCGNKNQKPCTLAPLCKTTDLTPINNKCVDCGKANQHSCAFKSQNEQCETGTVQDKNGKCRICGTHGKLACDGDTCEPQHNVVTNEEGDAICQRCGESGQPVCEQSPTCTKDDLTPIKGICTKCGKAGQPGCAHKDPECDVGSAEDKNGICRVCGTHNKPTCFENKCNSNHVEVTNDEGVSTCQRCGNLNWLACDTKPPCSEKNLVVKDGRCVKCGMNGQPLCANDDYDCIPGTVASGDVCRTCGGHNNIPCDDNTCNEKHVTTTNNDGVTICHKCGKENQLICGTSPSCDDTTLVPHNGICRTCGGLNQPRCSDDNKACIEGTVPDSNGMCRVCGSHGQLACGGDVKCTASHTTFEQESGITICRECGSKGQLVCGTGSPCDTETMTGYNGKCTDCGELNQPKCAGEECPLLSVEDDLKLCRVCGTHGKRPCAGDKCEPAHVLLTGEDYGEFGRCYSCGSKNQLPCTQGVACFNSTLVAHNDRCVDCGDLNQPMCDGVGIASCGVAMVGNGDGICQRCGNHGQLVCEGHTCEEGHTPAKTAENIDICVKCGGNNQPTCSTSLSCNNEDLTPYNGKCVGCGTSGKPECATKEEPCVSGTVGDHEDICRPCGKHNQLACSGGVCYEGLTTKPGDNDSTMCELCGNKNQKPCTLAPLCKTADLTPINNKCVDCGKANQHSCAFKSQNEQCETGTVQDKNGKCRICGTHGKLACDGDTCEPQHNVVTNEEGDAICQRCGESGQPVCEQSPTCTKDDLTPIEGICTKCGKAGQPGCAHKDPECDVGSAEDKNGICRVCGTHNKPTCFENKCNSNHVEVTNDEGVSTCQRCGNLNWLSCDTKPPCSEKNLVVKDGHCVKCGMNGQPLCANDDYDCIPGTVASGDVCRTCGGHNNIPCDDNTCNEKHVTTTNNDGVTICHKCGKENQLICGTSPSCDDTTLVPHNGICRTCGGLNQPRCSDDNKACIEGTVADSNGMCRVCGSHGQLACGGDVKCTASHTTFEQESGITICRECGSKGQLVCGTGSPCDTEMMTGYNGKCTECGELNQPKCAGEECPLLSVEDDLKLCRVCGTHGKRPCAGDKCEPAHVLLTGEDYGEFGRCYSCGKKNQIPCGIEPECESTTLVAYGNRCVDCGDLNQPKCVGDGVSQCGPRMVADSFGKCRMCGEHNELTCADDRCLAGHTVWYSEDDSPSRCVRCGSLKEPVCGNGPPCVNYDLTPFNNVCAACGKSGKPSCAYKTPSCEEGTVTDFSGICQPCGKHNQLACSGGVCNEGLTTKPGDNESTMCELCGNKNQTPCTLAPLCKTADLTPINNKCVDCGKANQHSCAFKAQNEQCETGTVQDKNGKCRICGTHGKLACDGDTCEPQHNVVTNEEGDAICQRCGESGQPVCEQTPTCTKDDLTPIEGICTKCGKAGQPGCAHKDPECDVGSAEDKNGICRVCGTHNKPTCFENKCNSNHVEVTNDEGVSTCQRCGNLNWLACDTKPPCSEKNLVVKDGHCVKCGMNGQPLCANDDYDCIPGTVASGDVCRTCGGHNNIPCDDNTCNEKHVTTTNNDGVTICHKCGKENQLICGTSPSCDDTTLVPHNGICRTCGGLNQPRCSDDNKACIEGTVPDSNGMCRVCGSHGQLACGGDVKCTASHTTFEQESGITICRECGSKGQLVCGTGSPCDTETMTGYNGKCTDCGELNQPKCAGEECPLLSVEDDLKLCRVCGTHGKRPCAGDKCEPAHVLLTGEDYGEFGRCYSCGSKNQLPCTQGVACFNSTLVAHNDRCVDCGDLNQPMCDGVGIASCGVAMVGNGDGICQRCGNHGQLVCEGHTCEEGHTPAKTAENIDICVKCGGNNQPTCSISPSCNNEDLTPYNGKCVGCGTSGKPECATKEEPCVSGTVGDHEDICRPCGKHNQLACSGGVCNEGLTTKPGDNDSTMCELCGNKNQTPCTLAPLCKTADLTPINNKCVDCGKANQHSCAFKAQNEQCETGTVQDKNGKCRICGTHGKLACDGDTCKPQHNVVTNEEGDAICQRCGESGQPVCEQSPTCTKDDLTPIEGICTKCGKAGQPGCAHKDPECDVGSAEDKNGICRVCGTHNKPTCFENKCNSNHVEVTNDEGVSTCQRCGNLNWLACDTKPPCSEKNLVVKDGHCVKCGMNGQPLCANDDYDCIPGTVASGDVCRTCGGHNNIPCDDNTCNEKHVTTTNNDGVTICHKCGKENQLICGTSPSCDDTTLVPHNGICRTCGGLNQPRCSDDNKACIEGTVPDSNGMCRVCGSHGQLACGGDVKCTASHTTFEQESGITICRECGSKGQLVCGTGSPCDAETMTGYNGKCTECGELNQPKCAGEECPLLSVEDDLKLCRVCGTHGKRPCAGDKCEPAHVLLTGEDYGEFGRCYSCGSKNQLPCSIEPGCEENTLVAYNNRCVDCGNLNQPMCDGVGIASCGVAMVGNGDGICQRCGSHGQLVCEGHTCEDGHTPAKNAENIDTCVKCGGNNQPTCSISPSCNNEDLTPYNGKCVGCGTSGKPECATKEEPCVSGTVGDHEDICRPCGKHNQLACSGGVCNEGLTTKPGDNESTMCELCGNKNQKPCTLAPLCKTADLTPINNKCVDCGKANQHSCAFKAQNEQCETGTVQDKNGKCRICGTHGKLACDGDTCEPQHNVVTNEEGDAICQRCGESGQPVCEQTPTCTKDDLTPIEGICTKCGKAGQPGCAHKDPECDVGSAEDKNGICRVCGTHNKPTCFENKCNSNHVEVTNDEGVSTCQRCGNLNWLACDTKPPCSEKNLVVKDGHCVKCGMNGQPLCANDDYDCIPGTVASGDVCRTCGGHNNIPCDDNTCNEKHVTTTNNDGVTICHKCGKENQLICGTSPSCDDTTLVPHNGICRTCGGLNQPRCSDDNKACIEGTVPDSNGMCRVCGSHGQLACGGDVKCTASHTTFEQESGITICRECGSKGQLVCGTGSPCDTETMTGYNGKCTDCGELNQPKCAGEECPLLSVEDDLKLCRVCGTHGKRPCAGDKCEPAHVLLTGEDYGEFGRCYSCGSKNQLPCTQGVACFNSTLVAHNDRCVDCGDLNQPMCDGVGIASCGVAMVGNGDGICQRCGNHGQLVCEGHTCEEGHTPAKTAENIDICVKCGGNNQPTCSISPSCNNEDLTPNNGKCVGCGTSGKPECATKEEPCVSGTVGDHEDICRPCGKHNQLACSGGVCNEGLTTKPGDNESTMCELCGNKNQKPCTLAPLCKTADLTPINNKCVDCGKANQHSCAFKAQNEQCETGTVQDKNGKCRICGTHGKLACDGDTCEPQHNVITNEEGDAICQRCGESGQPVCEQSPTCTKDDLTPIEGICTKCGKAGQPGCAHKDPECDVGSAEDKNGICRVCGTHNKPTCFENKCNSNHVEVTNDEGVSTCQRCGNLNWLACDTKPPCSEKNLVVKDGRCVKCGMNGQPLCANDDYDCIPGTVASGDVCRTCGGHNNIPCDDNTCNEKHVTTTNNDGVTICHKCGKENQLICGTSPSCDDTTLVPHNGICRTCGGLNQPRCSDDNKACIEGTVPDSNGMCRVCGSHGQLACGGDVKCTASHTTFEQESGITICRECGSKGQLVCGTGSPCDTETMTGYNGKCTDCGELNQPKCAGEECPLLSVEDELKLCRSCGTHGKQPCAIGTCELWHNYVAGSYFNGAGKCVSCGARNQVTCASSNSTCASPELVGHLGKCVDCGILNKPACTSESANACDQGLVVDETQHCRQCGGHGQLACVGGTCGLGHMALVRADGVKVCSACGGSNQLPCTGTGNHNGCRHGYTLNEVTQSCKRCKEGDTQSPGCFLSGGTIMNDFGGSYQYHHLESCKKHDGERRKCLSIGDRDCMYTVKGRCIPRPRPKCESLEKHIRKCYAQGKRCYFKQGWGCKTFVPKDCTKIKTRESCYEERHQCFYSRKSCKNRLHGKWAKISIEAFLENQIAEGKAITGNEETDEGTYYTDYGFHNDVDFIEPDASDDYLYLDDDKVGDLEDLGQESLLQVTENAADSNVDAQAWER